MSLRSILAAGVIALGMTATPALADITVLSGTGSGPLDPVTLDGGPLDFFVTGSVGPANTQVSFMGAEDLVVQGQHIQAATGDLNFLFFNLSDPGLAFTGAEFNLTAVADGLTSIFAYDQFGNQFGGDFSLAANGSNFFNISASNGQHISSVVIQSSTPIADARQVRLAGIAALVPEPGSWALMIIGAGGMGSVLRFRRRAIAQAA